MAKGNLIEKRTILSRIQDQLSNWHVDALLLIIGGIFIALLLYCFIFIWNFNSSKIQYTPDDIVYIKPLKAIHVTESTTSDSIKKIATTPSGSYPEMVISERFYDFGTVKTSEVLERVFIIVNHGQTPLLILRAYTTCGCTVADFTSSEIPPGKVALMKLYFDTGFHDLRGTTVRRGVIMQTNDPAQPQQEIWIQATVR
jgi:hypothetical protein